MTLMGQAPAGSYPCLSLTFLSFTITTHDKATFRNKNIPKRFDQARLANTHLKRARDASELAEDIMVDEHTGLECAGQVITKWYTINQTHIKNYNVRLGKYDGIHLYNQDGVEALTSILLAILHRAGMVRRPQ